MLLNIFYNYLVLVLISCLILWLTYYIKNICNCFKKQFLSEIVFILGLSAAISIPLIIPVYVSKKITVQSLNQVEGDLSKAPYKIIIYPKSYPFEDSIHISLKGEDKSLFLSIPDQNFDFDKITTFLIQYKPKIDLIFQE